MATLPKHILTALRDNKTSLGEHPSFPSEEDEKFVVNLISKTFDELAQKIPVEDCNTLKMELGKIIVQCKKID